ncbi:SHOCT domain-containing protein [Halolamina sp. CBA1230]|uniref:SHOCT domain-containing protein n=1 Tax=Halolamina sp. CBA1230 TaxID=1853690 RepID=UPI0009A1AC9C|nr:SHOCT domain-containing protein [Halolamina sp. CBA1230]QKY21174.1 SHOCT domain-containing protein [Halolamina sp. CBA1230]
MVPLKSWPGIALVLVVTLGLSALTAVLSLGALPAVVTIVGWFIVAPVLAILTYYEDEEGDADPERDDPVATLRERYARGELTEAEFERRLDQLLETEGTGRSAGVDGARERGERERVRER